LVRHYSFCGCVYLRWVVGPEYSPCGPWLGAQYHLVVDGLRFHDLQGSVFSPLLLRHFHDEFPGFCEPAVVSFR